MYLLEYASNVLLLLSFNFYCEDGPCEYFSFASYHDRACQWRDTGAAEGSDVLLLAGS